MPNSSIYTNNFFNKSKQEPSILASELIFNYFPGIEKLGLSQNKPTVLVCKKNEQNIFNMGLARY